MKSKILSILVVFTALFLSGCILNDNTVTNDEINYPNDFILKSTEVPSGFQLRTIDSETEEFGIVKNPGFLNNPAFFEQLYNSVDSSIIEQVFLSIYVTPDRPSTELGIFVVKYKSEESLIKENHKLKSSDEVKYLMIDNFLIIVWSDAGSYETELDQISEKLKERLNLKEI